MSQSLFRRNHGAAGGGHPIIELPCILYQTPRTLFANVSLMTDTSLAPPTSWQVVVGTHHIHLFREHGCTHQSTVFDLGFFVGQLASCSEWRGSRRPESQGESLGQCFICNCLRIGVTDPVLCLQVQLCSKRHTSLSRGDQDAKASPPPLAIYNNWAAIALSAEIRGVNPTWAELIVCARAQVAVR